MDNEEQMKKIEDLFMSPLERAERNLSDLYNDFTFSFLVRKKFKIGMIDNLVLEKNELKCNIENFINKMNAAEFGYVKIFLKTNRFIILRITTNGLNHFKKNSTMYKIIVPKQRERITRYVLNLIRISISFLFISAPRLIKTMIESWIIKLILFIIALVTFLLTLKII